jgi:Protein of unknown function (DUF2778)
MWTYSQKTGQLDHDGIFQGTGYSGKDQGRNDPAYEGVQGIGPLPTGIYSIGTAFDHPHLGPCVMALALIQGESFGRSGFFIHGNNAANDASHGCVILGPLIRQEIAKSPDRKLTVTP